MALSMIMGKKTPISALRECLNLAMRVRKMLQESAKAWGMDDVQFFSKLRHRYCLMAELNFSLVRNTSPLFSSRIISNSSASTYIKDMGICCYTSRIHHLCQYQPQYGTGVK